MNDERMALSRAPRRNRRSRGPKSTSGSAARVCRLPGKVQFATRIWRLENREVYARLEFGANLDRVAPANQAQAVDNVVDVLYFHRRLILRAAEAIQSVYVELRQAPVRRSERNSRDAEFSRKILCPS